MAGGVTSTPFGSASQEATRAWYARTRQAHNNSTNSCREGHPHGLEGASLDFCSRRYSLRLFESDTKSDGIISTVVLLFSAPTSVTICIRLNSTATGLFDHLLGRVCELLGCFQLRLRFDDPRSL